MNYTAEDIMKLLKHKYDGDKYVVLEEVPDGTGYGRRWIDAAVFALWPSEGLERMAFEIKVSRSDLIRELGNPVKNKWVKESFHQFWFVGPKDIIEKDEIPNGAGWMYPRGDKLCILKHCQRNDSPTLNDSLLAAFMRAAAKAITKSSKTTVKNFRDNDEAYKTAVAFQEAVLSFCESRDTPYYSTSHGKSKEDILKHLSEATMDKQLKKDRDHLLMITNSFQRQMAELFSLFAVIANRSLVEKDEFGKQLLSCYGANDTEAMAYLRGHKRNDLEKQKEELIKIILSWHTL